MKFEEVYKDYLITNQGLDCGFFIHTPKGMIWCRNLPDCYKYIDSSKK